MKKQEKVIDLVEAERVRRLEETEKQCMALGMAAERAAGRIRAMEWKTYQSMLLSVAHAASMINEVYARSVREDAPAIANAAQADLEGLTLALQVLGWNAPAVRGPKN